ncbi:MAG: VWA domain-containing protein, partial [Proteobacteria bacterium]|nr:VWA domain-containing protein [Pseudomonadota bacterium]
MSVEVTTWSAIWCGAAVLCVTVLLVARRWSFLPITSRAATALRGIAAALLCGALAGLVVVRTQEFSRGTIVLDISESMDESQAQELLDRALRYGGPQAKLDVLPFAKGAATAAIPATPGLSFNTLRSAWSKLNIGATNLEDGMHAVMGGEGQSIILISDGYETEGGVQRISAQLAAQGNKIYPLIPTEQQTGPQQFAITQLYAPLIAPAQKSVGIRVGLSNTTGQSQTGVLEILHGDKEVLSQRITLGPGQESVVTAESDPQVEGIEEITATLSPLQKELKRTVQRVYLSSEEREKLLLLSGSVEDERALKQVLKDQAYQVRALVAGQGEIPGQNLSDFSAVLFNNIGRDALPRKLVETVPEYVRDGGGFAMIGGNKSFGLGGYIDSPIEPVLPVELLPPQTEKKRLNVAVALVLDKSGSMSQSAKLDYAKEAANETVRNLKDDDFITVIGFDDAPFVVIRASRVA